MRSLAFTLLLAAASFSSSAAAADKIVAPDQTWKWLHPTDGVDPAKAVPDFHKSFFLATFDDSLWKEGKDGPGPHGGFAYGEAGFTGVDIGTPPKKGDNGQENHRKSAYFRLKLKTDKAFGDLVLKCQRDDGVIVYLDGKEVARDNMPGGVADAYGLFATEAIGNEAETTPIALKLPGSLAAGEHVLAISLHNRDGGSSDLRLAEVTLEGTPQ